MSPRLIASDVAFPAPAAFGVTVPKLFTDDNSCFAAIAFAAPESLTFFITACTFKDDKAVESLTDEADGFGAGGFTDFATATLAHPIAERGTNYQFLVAAIADAYPANLIPIGVGAALDDGQPSESLASEIYKVLSTPVRFLFSHAVHPFTMNGWLGPHVGADNTMAARLV